MSTSTSPLRYRLMGATALATMVGLSVIYHELASRHGMPGLAQVMTTPIGARQPAAEAPTKPSRPEVQVAQPRGQVPFTGGSMLAKEQRKDGGVDNANATVPAPASVDDRRTMPPAVAGEVNAGSIGLGVSVKQPAPTALPTPLPAEPTVERPADVDTTDTPQVDKPAAPFGMQVGAVIQNGQHAPGLAVRLTTAQIRQLIAAGQAVVIAENTTGQAVAFLAGPQSRFQSIGELEGSALSERYIAISDPGLVAALSLMVLDVVQRRPARFGLRFTRSADADIASAQFKALADRGIDFADALRRNRTLVTHGHFSETLAFTVDRVSG